MPIWNVYAATSVCSLLLIVAPGLVTAAGLPHNAWTLDAQYFVSGSSHYQVSRGNSATYASVANTAYLELSSRARPYSAGLFAEYRVYAGSQTQEALSMGAAARYNFAAWDATGYAFISKSPAAASHWFYAGRLRYRMADKHKIGLEAFGSVRSPRTPTIVLGYYGSVSNALSFNAFTGAGTSNTRDLSARAELVWQVR